MPSIAFTRWKSGSLRALDEIEAAHRAVVGRGAGRRFARQQIGHAYVVMLSVALPALLPRPALGGG